MKTFADLFRQVRAGFLPLLVLVLITARVAGAQQFPVDMAIDADEFYRRGDAFSERVSGFLSRMFKNDGSSQRSVFERPAQTRQPSYTQPAPQAPTYTQPRSTPARSAEVTPAPTTRSTGSTASTQRRSTTTTSGVADRTTTKHSPSSTGRTPASRTVESPPEATPKPPVYTSTKHTVPTLPDAPPTKVRQQDRVVKAPITDVPPPGAVKAPDTTGSLPPPTPPPATPPSKKIDPSLSPYALGEDNSFSTLPAPAQGTMLTPTPVPPGGSLASAPAPAPAPKPAERPSEAAPALSPTPKPDTTGQPVIKPGPPPDSQLTPSPTAATPPPGDYPVGKAGSKEGRVISPFEPHEELDVGGLPSGSLALDPTTQKVFRVP